MYSWKLDEHTNDLTFDAVNNITLVSGDDEIAQSVRMSLITNHGEWFLNQDFGLKRTDILGKRKDEEMIVAAINRAILQESRIRSLENIEFTRVGRTLEVKLQLMKQDGNLLETGVNLWV